MTHAPNEVVCYMYDISGGMARGMSQMIVGRQVDAIWHTGIVVFGHEYFFDGGVGIERGVPSRTRFGTPLKKVRLGTTTRSKTEFEQWNANEMRTTYGPSDYHVLQRNCNHYSDDAAKFLCNAGVPEEVKNQVEIFLSTPMGRTLQPMIENMMGAAQNRQPVQQPEPTHVPSPVTHAALERLLDSGVPGYTALKILSKIISNIVSSPSQVKYRSIRKTNKEFSSKVGSNRDAVTVLKTAGFTETTEVFTHYGKISQEFPTAIQNTLEIAEAIQASLEDDVGGQQQQQQPETPKLKWVRWTGQFPALPCVPAGSEANGDKLFAARSCASSVPGKCGAHLGHHVAVIDLTNNAEVARKGEILAVPEGSKASWVAVPPGAPTPPNAVVAGTSLQGNPLYVSRCRHEGGLHPGFSTSDAPHMCTIPYGGKGVKVSPCEVLVSPDGVSDSSAAREEAACNGLLTFEDLMSFDKNTVAGCMLPSRTTKKFEFYKTGTKILLCHDMQGNYTKADRSPYGAPRETDIDGLWRVRDWSVCDVFVYFSHCMVAVPPVGWVNACRANGVPCMASLVLEHADGQRQLSKMLASHDAMTNSVLKLVEIEEALGFSGYLINFEVSIPPTAVPLLIEFVELLKALSSGPVIWYDSVTFTGQVAYQNMVNDTNKIFMDAASGFFTNYRHTADMAERTAALVADRRHDVWNGIDVFGRGTYGGGGYKAHEGVTLATRFGLSCAMFAPAWTWENNSNSRQKFEAADDMLWSPIKQAHTNKGSRILSLPFTTTFNTGCGDRFHSKGRSLTTEPWYDLSQTSPVPPLPLATETGLRSEMQNSGGYDGCSCLKVDFSQGGAYVMGRLFDLGEQVKPTPQGFTLQIATKSADIGLLVAFTTIQNEAANFVLHPSESGPPGGLPMCNVYCTREEKSAGWVLATWTVPTKDVKALASVSLICVKKDGVPHVGLVGSFTMVAGALRPSALKLSNPKMTILDNGKNLIEFTASGPVQHTDVYSLKDNTEKWLNRVHGNSVLVPKEVGTVVLRATDETGQPLEDFVF
eukprot:TRINITY_DN16666_c0_g1_i1.p1 TRINITY_DN16666_c0_g1~~TRINITY_DN16666_c0_g1_i1.p1  ORF type:complete len:1040 (+),score=214.51 TRINITY_DN16666_c0_g1_i1:38-3157(+)